MSVTTIVSRSALTVTTEIKVDEKKDDVIDVIDDVVPDDQLLEEVIPDDLSEFSDEADEILNRQEVSNLFVNKTILFTFFSLMVFALS